MRTAQQIFDVALRTKVLRSEFLTFPFSAALPTAATIILMTSAPTTRITRAAMRLIAKESPLSVSHWSACCQSSWP